MKNKANESCHEPQQQKARYYFEHQHGQVSPRISAPTYTILWALDYREQ